LSSRSCTLKRGLSCLIRLASSSSASVSVEVEIISTVAVAAIHGVVIGLALSFMKAPLVIPLAVLVFLAAFVPLVGLLAAGALALMVTLAAKGWVDAVILLGVLNLTGAMKWITEKFSPAHPKIEGEHAHIHQHGETTHFHWHAHAKQEEHHGESLAPRSWISE